MGEDGGKRKGAPAGAASAQNKKKKTGNSGKWQTPHQKAKVNLDGVPQQGDIGIWVTCARHQENKAAKETAALFEQYATKVYGIKEEEAGEDDDDDEDDIEAAIHKEVAALNAKGGDGDAKRTFTIMKMNVDCLLFVKTRAPINPIDFVRRICIDAKDGSEPGQIKCRYVNRFTPASVMGKATEEGLLEVARQALSPYFDLGGKRAAAAEEKGEQTNTDAVEAKADGAASTVDAAAAAPTPASAAEQVQSRTSTTAFTFAIRPTIRNHSKLKRDFVIDQIARLVNDDVHKVNLTAPDKVILVDLYQGVCSMSVVDGDWDELKRYNITEIYGLAAKRKASEREAKPEKAVAEEAEAEAEKEG
ncbi:hypothetical protein B0T22DRAFT_441427 [Podospora appendiculata]|uniref:THUMP domain-containing protein n=1 Tax=Podospora appendiculata TaxID=314037 RepID=A0AAE0XC46_9PEZI|nr:hypothetical protein B0T22DRAFT_441427 [Podospora appendiculata]